MFECDSLCHYDITDVEIREIAIGDEKYDVQSESRAILT